MRPRMSHGCTVTVLVWASRFALPALASIVNPKTFGPIWGSGATHTGVAMGVPFLRVETNEMYLAARIASIEDEDDVFMYWSE